MSFFIIITAVVLLIIINNQYMMVKHLRGIEKTLQEIKEQGERG